MLSAAAAMSGCVSPPQHPRALTPTLRWQSATPVLRRRIFRTAASPPTLGITMHSNKRVFTICASNFDQSNANVSKPEGSSSSQNTGPPVATILAGVVVFLLFLWFAVSILGWIVGLIVNVPSPPK